MGKLANSLLLFSGTKVESGNSKLTPLEAGHRKDGSAFIKVTAVSGTGSPTLDVDIISYDEETDDWYVIGTFTQLTAEGKERIYLPATDEKLAIQYVIADTSPSFTFKVSVILKD